MTTTILTRVSISADQKRVFEYLTNLKYHYLWNPNIRNISSKEKLQLGSTYKTDSVVLGIKISAKNYVTKFVFPSELELENNTGTVKYRASFKLNENSSKTILVCKTTVSTNSKAFVFSIPLLKRLARKELQSDLQALKIAIEHRLK